MQLHQTREIAMAAHLKLISHKLCPYVQRAVIALTEKGVSFERIDIDLANKPDWFLGISPLGKTPVLQVGETAIFESAVILEYLEETQPKPLHPSDPLRRAEHRGWIEFGSAVLGDIAGFYSAPDKAAFKAKASQLEQRFARLEARVAASPWFDGESFSLVDRCFVISMCSTRSPILEFLRASRSSPNGARRSRRGHRYDPPSARNIRRCFARSSSGGIRGCRDCKRATRPDYNCHRPA
jgi:glutathione S-transferase